QFGLFSPRSRIALFFLLLLFLLLLFHSLFSSSLFLLGPQICPLSDVSRTSVNCSSPPSPADRPHRYDTQLKHIVFCIGASSHLWNTRKEYLKIWWRQNETRVFVWVDEEVKRDAKKASPEIRVSGNTSHFNYTNTQGTRSALRITRAVSETLRLGVKDVRWFVMGDDDTVFVVENLIRILSKYDHKQLYYIGHTSESHIQNIFFSYAMAFGGGGFAISYPLAKELEKMQDHCIQRYPSLYGSDDRIQACMAELGVPLTREPGFHQYDVYGNLLGLLGAHPVAPLVSLHHLDVVDPVFPRMSRVQALHHLFYASKDDTASMLQQSICYDKVSNWSISVSWGYVVQIVRGVMLPRDMEMPMRTFVNWYPQGDFMAYSFNTRPVSINPCQKPFIFYVKSTRFIENRKQIVGVYTRDHEDIPPSCKWKMKSPDQLDSVVVVKRQETDRWLKSPRRDCCRVMQSNKKGQMQLWVGNCREGEISVA
ncbi:O-fucosylpeptide 3-beta-N-acetylglucosaminyltransferase, partial [Bertholletia excelsa]